MSRPAASLFVALLALAACRTAPEVRAPQPASTRLPTDVHPISQAIALSVDPEKTAFSGTSRIELELTRETNRIALHGRTLHVTSVKLTRGAEVTDAKWVDTDADEGFAEVRLAHAVAPGKAPLEIAYDAPFDDQLEGLYRVQDGGRWYAFTQFEALFARRAFPCFDEPSFKIPFTLSITTPSGNVAVANTPASGGANGGTFTFPETAPLPSYLVAFAVGPFDIVAGPDVPPSDVRAKPLPLRAIATKGKGAQLKYVLEKTGGLVQALEKYFGVAYPYPKLDLVAVPDFAAGAMENAGLITFREWLILMNKSSPVDQRRALGSVVAHELSHQWFGNLVTMKWWDDLWLNEAFASWMGDRTVAEWDPSSKADLDFLSSVEEAMSEDSLVSARQIRQPIVTSHDVTNAFDGITYGKGSGVIAMFERFAGPDRFRAGVQAYFAQHRFGNTTADDFLAAVSTAAGRDIATPFHTFLDQPGVPLVDVTLDCAAAPTLRVKQSRYLPLHSTGDAAHTWQIPMCLRYETAGQVHQQCELISQPSATIALEGGACPTWLHPNLEGAGYYRFKLDDVAQQHLADAQAKLSIREQMAFADSLSAAVTAGALPFERGLGGLAALASSTERRVAQSPFELIGMAHDDVVPAALRAKVETWSRGLLVSHAKELTFAPQSGDPEAMLAQKTMLTFALFTARDPALQAAAAKLGRAYLGLGADGELHPEVIDPTFAEFALDEAVRAGDASVFDVVEKHLRASSDPAMRRRLLGALGNATGPLEERARVLALSPDVRASELRFVIGPLTHRLETRESTWEWLKTNYDAFVAKMPAEYAGYTPWNAATLCTEAAAKDAETFFGPRIEKLQGGPRNLAGALEALHLCAAHADAYRASAVEFFGKQ